jgi:ribosome biogenesis GTPase
MSYECRARGKFRLDGISPLVGDDVEIETDGNKGTLVKVYPRRNHFIRPAVANVDVLIIMASGVIPVTDPFLIDRVAAIAERAGCDVLICINKTDWTRATSCLTSTARPATGSSAPAPRPARARMSCWPISRVRPAPLPATPVWANQYLNAIAPEFGLEVGDVSEKLAAATIPPPCGAV